MNVRDYDMKNILNKKLVGKLMEMRVAPDQSLYPLSRRQVERMLAQHERREDENNYNDDPEYRSKNGWEGASWYPPDIDSDYTQDSIDLTNSTERPAKLMPYDYFYTNYSDADKEISHSYEVNDNDDRESPDKFDWSGEHNVFEDTDLKKKDFM